MNNQGLSESDAAVIIQKWFRGNKSRQASKKFLGEVFQRKKIIQEIVTTEETYIHNLGVIVSDFQMHLINQKILTKSDAYQVFCNVDAIRRLNEDFFTILYNQFQQYSHYKVIFEDVKKQTYFFKIYFEYLNNFPASLIKIKNLKENCQQFKDFMQKISKNEKYNRWQLDYFLIKPVQRIPQYVLLLRNLVKKTPADHPDFNNIIKVLKCFEEVNQSNNEKLNKLINNFKLSEIQRQAKLPFIIAEPGVEFILEQRVNILTSYNKNVDAIIYLLNNRLILTKRPRYGQKYIESVNFKQGATIIQNQEQENYKHSFTVQSLDGQSITLLFQSQQQKIQMLVKIQEQIFLTEKNTYDKYTALYDNNQVTQQLRKKVCRLNLVPEVVVLGTEERTDKMLKYTTYIIEVKIKNVRQKIFMRFSQLLAIQTFISIEYPKMQVKQSLYKTTWILNHKPRTIEQRKMSIQRFLREVLSKPEIIEDGQKVLGKLGLPRDFYSLPAKFKDGAMLKGKNNLSQRSTKSQKRNTVQSRKSYRLSIFEDLQPEENQKNFRNHSYNDTLIQSTHIKKLTIQQMLHANQMHLGHYTRYSENLEKYTQKLVKVQIYLPWIEYSKGLIKKTIDIFQCQRISVLINKLSKQIGLKYHKDFRLFLQRDYSYRVLDDDQMIDKVQKQLASAGNYILIFKKMVYIDRQLQEREIKNDRLRLKLIASQVVYEVKQCKYKLDYKKILLLSVLIGIIQHQCKTDRQNRLSQGESSMRATFQKQVRSSEPNYSDLALSTRELLANPYTSFFENSKVWIQDFTEIYKNLYQKLSKISSGNTIIVRTSLAFNHEQEFNWTNISQLCYIAILDEIKNDQLFGSMCYIVQISEEFRKNIFDQMNELEIELDEQTIENRNVWFIIKCRQVLLYSIDRKVKLFSINYCDIQKIKCYPSSIILTLTDSEPIKLKTTNSFCINQLLNYYSNYNDISKKMDLDDGYKESILDMIHQSELIISNQLKSSMSIEYDEQHNL